MGLSGFLLKILAKKNQKKHSLGLKNAIKNQNLIFKNIITKGESSLFGKKHQINRYQNYNQFTKTVPVVDYENLSPYIEKISRGEKNILTKGRPLYFAITSGTTSGTKYIPLTNDMLHFQIQSIKELLLLYAYQTNSYDLSLKSGMMFIQGSPTLSHYNKMPFAKLSGITARHVPLFLQKNRYPSMATNKIENWDEKIHAIVKETHDKDMRVIGGIPAWVINYFEALLKFTKRETVKNVFPGMSLYIHGGASFIPYKKTFLNLCGDIDTLEVYPASEGFFAYQDDVKEKAMLLLTNHGVFYEFIPLVDFHKKNMNRVPLEGVVLHTEYVMIVSTVAGLWGYNTGDTVQFVSKNPYKIVFCGRASQYCSTFGEHVIEKEIQTALSGAIRKFGGAVKEFTVCPKINTPSNLSQHEWFIEFSLKPQSLSSFSTEINTIMKQQNIYYRDLLNSGVIQPLKVLVVKTGGFNDYMKSIGKFGGQNKCPHLSNDREIGEFLLRKYV